jgi:hypothetical protein
MNYLHGAEYFLISYNNSQLVVIFPAFHATRRFIAVFIRARDWSLS